MAGPSSAKLESRNEIESPEKVAEQVNVHSTQPPADNAGAERSSVKEEKVDDGDDTGSIIYTPEGSDEEDEGQEPLGSSRGRIIHTPEGSDNEDEGQEPLGSRHRSIIYTPEGSDDEDEGQQAGRNKQHEPCDGNIWHGGYQ